MVWSGENFGVALKALAGAIRPIAPRLSMVTAWFHGASLMQSQTG
jgi:hypothetical protein